MSKIVLSKPVAGYNLAAINDNFTKLEAEFQDKVLYRNNPSGEPNTLETDLDLNGKNLLNVGSFNGVPGSGLSDLAAYVDTATAAAAAASVSETNAAASYDSFDDRYLGAKASAPTLDNDGNTLLVGAMYWNTTSSQLFTWSGSVWSATSVPGGVVGVSSGGTGSTTASAARTALGAAASGPNADITSLDGVLVGKGAGGISTNTRYGEGALIANTTGSNIVSMGYRALAANTTGFNLVAVGAYAGFSATTAYDNTLVGVQAGENATGNGNSFFGRAAGGGGSCTGSSLTCVGVAAGQAIGSGNNCTYVGYSAGYGGSFGYSNSSGFGANSEVTGSNQVQLGDSGTTTYAYGAVQNRSDLRDKADVRDTVLGLWFINALRAVDFRWDMREDYRPQPPAPPDEDAPPEQMAQYELDMAAHKEAACFGAIVRDGSKKRSRYHHGLISQQVRTVIEASGVDFGGFQDHSLSGGDDVLSIGYEELIAPLIKAVQELSATVTAQAARIEALEARL